MDVELTEDSSGAGRGGEGQTDVLPPLMLGMKHDARLCCEVRAARTGD